MVDVRLGFRSHLSSESNSNRIESANYDLAIYMGGDSTAAPGVWLGREGEGI